MRAVVARGGKLTAESVPDPVPLQGHVLTKTLYCGICGSDLHALQMQGSGASLAAPSCVMGHEFCAEVLDYGPGTDRRFPIGSTVCSMPMLLNTPSGPQGIGYSPDFPGGYGERMVLEERLLIRVPDGLPAERAALTEPLAVGVHAVGQADLQPEIGKAHV